jgi:hypothetical protein
MIRMVIIASAAVISTQAFAQSAPTPMTAPTAATAANSADDKIVCEKEEQIGSRLGARKVCMTVKQWAEQRRIEREQVEKFQQQNTAPGNQGG